MMLLFLLRGCVYRNDNDMCSWLWKVWFCFEIFWEKIIIDKDCSMFFVRLDIGFFDVIVVVFMEIVGFVDE